MSEGSKHTPTYKELVHQLRRVNMALFVVTLHLDEDGREAAQNIVNETRTILARAKGGN